MLATLSAARFSDPAWIFERKLDGVRVLVVRDGDQLTLWSRKEVLRQAFAYDDPLRYSVHRNTDGEAFYDEACRKGWEGLIAKRADSTYSPGRSRDWLKLKCSYRQEFVIGGFTEPRGSRVGFGALLIGYYEHGDLRYAGKVGTGYSTETLRTMRARLDDLEQADPPFADRVREAGAHWTRPELVAEVAFSEWTGDGMLRHPRFAGLRTDKPAADVVRETPG